MPTSGQFVVGELVTASDANSLFVRGYRNRIINGAFVINQRNYVSATNLASGSYGFDRWKSGFTNTALTFTAGSQSTTVTISTSGVLQQIIERENVPAGTYVLSWSGTATGRIYNSGGAAPGYAASPVTVTLDGLANVVVEFTASGGTRTLGTVQLEAGSVYSPFEYRLREEEIALCQRYYTQTSANSGFATMAIGMAISTTATQHPLQLPVTMRATPTQIIWNGLRVHDNVGTGGAPTGVAINATFSSAQVAMIDATGLAGLSQYRPYFLQTNNVANAYLGIGAEL